MESQLDVLRILLFTVDIRIPEGRHEAQSHGNRPGPRTGAGPGGQDEQLETICGRERVYLKSRKGVVRLAMIHNVPLVPAYCFGSSDLYRTYGAFYGARRWLVRNLRIALPLYSGDWGFFCYPTPKGFPLQVPQDIVFGEVDR